METGVAALVLAVHIGVDHGDVVHVAVIYVLHKLGKRYFLLFGTGAASLYDLPEQNSGKQDYQPERYGLNG
jgi:hypothetical protein